MSDKLSKLSSVFKKYGFVGFLKKIWAYFLANFVLRFDADVLLHESRYRNEIRSMLASDCGRVILWRDRFGYNVPLFQRPQHMAAALAAHGCLVIYEVTTMTDSVRRMKKQCEGLYLFNFNNTLLNRILNQELASLSKPKYIQIYSTDWNMSVSELRSYADSGFCVIYEYIDHICAELAGTKELPVNIREKYEYVMTHRDCFVVATAQLLYDDAASRRGSDRLTLATNGVDYDFFQNINGNYTFEPEFRELLDSGKPLLCYYGALASWFDWELLREISDTGKYTVVLFGAKYDDSFDRYGSGLENVKFLGARDYSVLKNYAAKADVLMIPFLINDITRSTSPVKIFEYMALHKPVVTTEMPECLRYSSVLIGKTHAEFLQKLDMALEMRDSAEYISMLDADARLNDWQSKAEEIINMLRSYET